ncbi:ATP-dependent dethiobiotin synthetase BioD [Rickettsiales bacterium]|nr:ATP-dependent dethiobiotin synthetase BioD [Rickettsiales bacterium]
MKTFFVTATGTDIGKTFITCAMCRHYISKGLKVQAIKPIISGWSGGCSDTHLLLESSGLSATQQNIDAISPWRFSKPLSPNVAARAEGKVIDFDSVVDFCKSTLFASKADYFFVEGAGGIMSPITDHKTCLDLALALDLPLVLITGTYLGAISHSLTAVQSAVFSDVSVRCLVVNESVGSNMEVEDVVSTLKNFLDMPIYKIFRGRWSFFDL